MTALRQRMPREDDEIESMPPGPQREWHSQLPAGGHGLGMAEEELERRPRRGRTENRVRLPQLAPRHIPLRAVVYLHARPAAAPAFSGRDRDHRQLRIRVGDHLTGFSKRLDAIGTALEQHQNLTPAAHFSIPIGG